MQYSSIHIIYNPNSTGDSEAMAKDLQVELRENLTDIKIECIATKYAGHAEKLALQIARQEKQPLIVSSSGDGGYNEVVNGVMKAQNDQAMCAVLPAGNANDHSRAMHKKPLSEQIMKGKVTHIDLLKVTVQNNFQETQTRYAHSYAGLGITPVVAVELNKRTLNALWEIKIVLQTFLKYRPFRIRHNDKILRLDSLLFANINQMAKVLSLAPKNRPRDGRFEMILFPAGKKWQLIKRLTKAAAFHLENIESVNSYTFTTVKKMPMQMDGEVLKLPRDCKVLIESAAQVLSTIV